MKTIARAAAHATASLVVLAASATAAYFVIPPAWGLLTRTAAAIFGLIA